MKAALHDVVFVAKFLDSLHAKFAESTEDRTLTVTIFRDILQESRLHIGLSKFAPKPPATGSSSSNVYDTGYSWMRSAQYNQGYVRQSDSIALPDVPRDSPVEILGRLHSDCISLELRNEAESIAPEHGEADFKNTT